MDLLTVLAHELGHLLSYEHSEEGVMEESLAAGTRRLPAAGPTASARVWVDSLFAAAQILSQERHTAPVPW